MTRFIQFSISLFLLLQVCACSRAHPPGVFTQADRLVATNRFRASVAVTLTGTEVKRIAKAVATSTEDKNLYPAIYDCRMEFYNGAVILGAIDLHDRAFFAEGTQYSDSTGVLAAFYDKWQMESSGRGD